MPKTLPIFYSALLLTAVNLLLRLAGTLFQIYLSGQIGPAGIGLLQLVMSVGSLASVAGMAGVRTAAMYLTAEELGRHRSGVGPVLSSCLRYSICFSSAAAMLLWSFAPMIARHWIGNEQTTDALRLFAGFLPVSCLSGVMCGYYTAANRIGTLAVVEVAEQLAAITATVLSLHVLGADNGATACQCVILGSGLGACLTLVCLAALRKKDSHIQAAGHPVLPRLLRTALPLAAGDLLRSGIGTVENLLVPKRLAINTSVEDPLAAFGLVSGMVFPLMMFPACILHSLAELLIPELARCAARDMPGRIRYLVQRSLKVAMVYGFVFAGLMAVLAEPLCQKLYASPEAGHWLRLYALMIPLLYCDALTDAMTKGLGQQKVCVRYNILTNAMDVVLLYILLPGYGMEGYFFSFLVTHLLNFLLSLRRLLKITGVRIPCSLPALTFAAALTAVCWADRISGIPGKSCGYLALMGSLLCLFRILGSEDVHWMKGLLGRKK